jgi:carbamoyl-phosphate synthase large subunit
MEHVEAAGIHSGDSTCWLPPQAADPAVLETLAEYTRRIGLALPVRGLMNVQYAVQGGVVYVLEVNPRASRTVPFVSKAVGVPLARLGALVRGGEPRASRLVEVQLSWRSAPSSVRTGFDPMTAPDALKAGGELSDGPGEAYRKALGAGTDLRAALAGPVLLSFGATTSEAGVLRRSPSRGQRPRDPETRAELGRLA